MVALFFLSGRFVNAEPVGDFFKKVGQSVSKAFQPQPTPNPTNKKTTKRASRRPTSPHSNLVGASPTPLEQPTNLVKQEKVITTVTELLAVSVQPDKAKADLH